MTHETFANLPAGKTHVMGILNVTPDSFSDGGQHHAVENAIARGMKMAEEGAAMIDIGGESTRPNAAPVSLAEEQSRVLPVIEALAKKGLCLSVDTRNAAVMRSAVAAGAQIINDVSALSHDPESLETAANLAVPVILMHMQGSPQTMQQNPRYDDVVAEVYAYLQKRIDACLQAGIPRSCICVDPGIGFGKTLEHNLALLRNLQRFKAFGTAVLLGASRKSFIGALDKLHGKEPDQRLGGSLAAALAAARQQVDIVRVHDVAETVQALKIWQTLH